MNANYTPVGPFLQGNENLTWATSSQSQRGWTGLNPKSSQRSNEVQELDEKQPQEVRNHPENPREKAESKTRVKSLEWGPGSLKCVVELTELRGAL